MAAEERFTSQKRINAGNGNANRELYYYGARWYLPGVGIFTQPDSIVPDPSNPQDLNRYAYARNNPLRYADPTGHDPGDWINDEWKQEFYKAHGYFPELDDYIHRWASMAQASGYNLQTAPPVPWEAVPQYLILEWTSNPEVQKRLAEYYELEQRNRKAPKLVPYDPSRSYHRNPRTGFLERADQGPNPLEEGVEAFLQDLYWGITQIFLLQPGPAPQTYEAFESLGSLQFVDRLKFMQGPLAAAGKAGPWIFGFSLVVSAANLIWPAQPPRQPSSSARS